MREPAARSPAQAGAPGDGWSRCLLLQEGPVSVRARTGLEIDVQNPGLRETGAADQLDPHALAEHAVMVPVRLMPTGRVGRGDLEIEHAPRLQHPVQLRQREERKNAVLD